MLLGALEGKFSHARKISCQWDIKVQDEVIHEKSRNLAYFRVENTLIISSTFPRHGMAASYNADTLSKVNILTIRRSQRSIHSRLHTHTHTHEVTSWSRLIYERMTQDALGSMRVCARE